MKKRFASPVKTVIWAQLVLAVSALYAADEAKPPDLPPLTAAPPLHSLKSKPVARLDHCERPFFVCGVDAVFFFRGGSLFRADVLGPRAGREQKILEDARLERTDDKEVELLTAVRIAGRAFAVVNAQPTALVIDLDGGRLSRIHGLADGRDAAALEVEQLVLARGSTVLCAARMRGGPSEGDSVWAKLDLANGDARLYPPSWSLAAFDASGEVAVFRVPDSSEIAVELNSGRQVATPDDRLVATYRYEADEPVVAERPLSIKDPLDVTRTVGVATDRDVTFPVHFPRDVREPEQTRVAGGFAAYLVAGSRGSDLLMAQMQPNARARRVARDVNYPARFIALSGGHCLFGGGQIHFGDDGSEPRVYAFDRHVVWNPLEGMESRVAAFDDPHLRLLGTGTTISSSVSPCCGTAAQSVWGLVNVTRRAYDPRQVSEASGMIPEVPVAPVTVLISPRGNRFVVDLAKSKATLGGSTLLSVGALVFETLGENHREPGIVIHRLKLPDESPVPHPERSPAPESYRGARPVERLLHSGFYRRGEIAPPGGGGWLGLFEFYETFEEPVVLDGGCFIFDTPDRYDLTPCDVTTRAIDDSPVEDFRLLRVASSNPDREVFLVRDVPGLTPGPVDVAKRTNSHAGADPVSGCGALDASVSWSPVGLQLGDALYQIETASASKAGSPEMTIMCLSSGTTAQELLRAERSALRWAGDLDRDGRLDLYVDQGLPGEETRRILFLSSLAKPGDLVGEAGRIEAEFHPLATPTLPLSTTSSAPGSR